MTSAKILLDESARPESWSSSNPRIAHEIMQFVPHPHPERNIEALLRAVQDFARQAILESFFDQPLAFAIVQFMPRRNGEGPFYEPMIEKRHPRLEPVRHRHPIHLRQHLADQGRFDVGVELAGQLLVS